MKDYSKKDFLLPSTAKKQKIYFPNYLIILVGIAFILLGIYFYTDHFKRTYPHKRTQHVKHLAKKNNSVPHIHKQNLPIWPKKRTENTQLDFYTLLPHLEVRIPSQPKDLAIYHAQHQKNQLKKGN